MYKRATLYSSEVNEIDGERERVTVSTKFKMTSVYKFEANFANALKQVFQRGYERCTSDIKKELHNVCSGEFTLTPALELFLKMLGLHISRSFSRTLLLMIQTFELLECVQIRQNP